MQWSAYWDASEMLRRVQVWLDDGSDIRGDTWQHELVTVSTDVSQNKVQMQCLTSLPSLTGTSGGFKRADWMDLRNMTRGANGRQRTVTDLSPGVRYRIATGADNIPLD